MQGYAPQPNAKHREKKDQHIHLDFKKKNSEKFTEQTQAFGDERCDYQNDCC